MSHTSEKTPQTSAGAAGVDRSELMDFIPYLKSLKDFEPLRHFIRVTPRGLFVENSVTETVVALYQKWFHEFTRGEVSRTIDKSRVRLFGDQKPDPQYLVEGKTVLLGVLASGTVQNPQQTGLPYYLGALVSSRQFLHPKDPQLAALPGLSIRTTQTGSEISVQLRDRALKIPKFVLDDFAHTAALSPFLVRRNPGMDQSLAIALRVLVSVASRARPVRKDAAILVPHRFQNARNATIRLSRKFLLVEQSGELKFIAELNGRNLSEFLRNELSSGPKQSLGSFRLSSRRAPNIGEFHIKGVTFTLRPRAFAEFVEFITRAKDPREKFNKAYTTQECFEKFSSFFQLAQPFDRRKLEKALGDRGITARDVRVYGGWIFAISKRGVITRVAARHIRLPRPRKMADDEDEA